MHTALKIVQCKICEKLFYVGKGKSKANTHYCNSCKPYAEKERLRRSSTKNKLRTKLGVENIVQCKHCGKTFNRNGTSKVTCSDNCKLELKRKKSREFIKNKRKFYPDFLSKKVGGFTDLRIKKIDGEERVLGAVILEKVQKRIKKKV